MQTLESKTSEVGESSLWTSTSGSEGNIFVYLPPILVITNSQLLWKKQRLNIKRWLFLESRTRRAKPRIAKPVVKNKPLKQKTFLNSG